MRVQEPPIAPRPASVTQSPKTEPKSGKKTPVELKNSASKAKSSPKGSKDHPPVPKSNHGDVDRLELHGVENAKSRVLKVYDRMAHHEKLEIAPEAREKLSVVAEKLSEKVATKSQQTTESLREPEERAERQEQQNQAREAAADALEKAAEVVEKNPEELTESATDAHEEAREDIEETTDTSMEFRASLLDRIESYLQDNNLNQYGDPMGTIYTGGTPLFNSQSGEIRNRMEYLLEKFPELTAA